jgi:hypothetical protein
MWDVLNPALRGRFRLDYLQGKQLSAIAQPEMQFLLNPNTRISSLRYFKLRE